MITKPDITVIENDDLYRALTVCTSHEFKILIDLLSTAQRPDMTDIICIGGGQRFYIDEAIEYLSILRPEIINALNGLIEKGYIAADPYRDIDGTEFDNVYDVFIEYQGEEATDGFDCDEFTATVSPYPVEFNGELKFAIKERDGNKCAECSGEDNLCVHHIDYNKKNCDTNNLITLCQTCHLKTNVKSKREGFTKHYRAILGVLCPT